MSLKDVANETGHNAALVNYYFKTKENLYRECVMPLIGSGMASAERILRPATCRQDFLTRFQLFVEEFFATHLQQQDLCMILHRDLHTEVVQQLFKEHFICIAGYVRVFFESARKCKFLRRDVDPLLLTHFVVGSMFHLITSDRFRADIGEPVFLKGRRRDATVRMVTALFLQGCIEP